MLDIDMIAPIKCWHDQKAFYNGNTFNAEGKNNLYTHKI